MADFVNFETVGDSNIDEIDDEQIIYETVCDDDDDNFDDNLEDYYAFANVSRNYEGDMQDSFIDFDWSQEANNYCMDDYDPSKRTIGKFKNSAKKS